MRGPKWGAAATRFYDAAPFSPARLQQQLEATALGRFAEGFVAGCQRELLPHRQFQIRGVIHLWYVLARRSL